MGEHYPKGPWTSFQTFTTLTEVSVLTEGPPERRNEKRPGTSSVWRSVEVGVETGFHSSFPTYHRRSTSVLWESDQPSSIRHKDVIFWVCMCTCESSVYMWVMTVYVYVWVNVLVGECIQVWEWAFECTYVCKSICVHTCERVCVNE